MFHFNSLTHMRTISNYLKRVLADGANVPTHFLVQHRSNECFVIFSKLKIFAIKLNSLECLSSRNDAIFSYIQWNTIIASNCNFDCRMLLAFAWTRCERYAPTFDKTNRYTILSNKINLYFAAKRYRMLFKLYRL